MKKVALFALSLALSGCGGLPSADKVQHAFARAHPDYKVQEVLLTEQKEQEHYTAQFTIRYTKPSDNPPPVPPAYLGGHTDAWYYNQKDGAWIAGRKETLY